MSNPNERFDWRRTAITAAVVTAVGILALGVAAIPVVRRELADRQDQRVKALYATGLISCKFHSDDIDALLQKYLPATPTASVTAYPSFSPPIAIRLVGRDLYYFVLDFPLYETTGDPPYKFNASAVPTIYHARVSNEVARKLPMVLANDIRHSRLAEREFGLDGTQYVFHASAASCAWTWSPDFRTRAGHFVDLVDQLAKLAESGGGPGATTSEQRILAILKSLQPR